MSSTIQAICANCDEVGPRIHRNAGGAVGLWPNLDEDIFDEALARTQWNRWIIDHEFCDFTMMSQGSYTPREEFEKTFGPIVDEQWQWLKEFCKRQPVT